MATKTLVGFSCISLYNFDTTMLPRIGYAFLLGMAIIVASYICVRIWEIGEHHIRKHCKTKKRKDEES